MPTRCNRGFYCRSYFLLNTFRASLCPSSGAQEYYTVVAVAACGISCCKNVKNNFVSFCGICVLSLNTLWTGDADLHLLHYNCARRMTQICVFNTRLVSTHYTLNYAIHGAFLQMVLLTDVYRNVISLRVFPGNFSSQKWLANLL